MFVKKHQYKVIRNFISKERAANICNYFLFKRKVAKAFFDNGGKDTDETYVYGTFCDPQVPNVYCSYSDFVLEHLLEESVPKIYKYSKIKVVPTYTFMRIYEKGSILTEHKDRNSCEISATLHCGGAKWPFYVYDKKDIRIDLTPGDCLIYRGCEIIHWREPLKGNYCVQAFMHYNDVKGPFVKKNKYDRRKYLGLPYVSE